MENENNRQTTRSGICSRALLLLITLFLFMPSFCFSMEPEPDSVVAASACDCSQAVTLLQSQKKANSREFRHLKRELGNLKVTMSKPGLTEILGGIGYIIGLFGLSYYWYARNLLRERH